MSNAAMNGVQLIDAALLSRVVAEAQASPRGRKNYNFHTADDFPVHRLLNAVEPGSYIMPHRHLGANKDETILAVQGKLGVVVFDEAGKVMCATWLAPGGAACGIDIPRGVYHTVFAGMPGTVMFESKGGPFSPLTSEEKAPWAPAEGAAEAAVCLQGWLDLLGRQDECVRGG